MKTSQIRRVLAFVAMLLFGTYSAARADSTLSIERPTTLTPLVSTNYRTSAAALMNVSLEAISLHSVGGPSTVKKVKIKVMDAATRPSSVFIGPQTQSGVIEANRQTLAPDGTAEFSLGNYGAIADDLPRTYVIKAEFDPASLGNNPNGDFCRIQVLSVEYTTALGNQAVCIPSMPWIGPEHRFYPVVANWTLVSAPTTSRTSTPFGTRIDATFKLRATVAGGDVLKPVTKDVIVIATIGRETVLCDTSAFTVVPSSVRITSGSTGTVTVTAQLPLDDPSSVMFQREGIVQFKVAQINWAVEGTNAFSVAQTWGLEKFVTTPSESITADIRPPVRSRLPSVSPELWEDIAALSAPDATGFSGQVVSEGGVLHITPTRPNKANRVVFPQANSAAAGIMQAEVDMTVDSMVPRITVPYVDEETEQVGMIGHPVENVQNQTEAGKTVAVRFEVLIGGLRMYGVARRTGDRSCLLNFYWPDQGEQGAYGIPGQNLDLLDLSGSLPPVPPATGKAYPPRFRFGNFDYLTKDAQGFRMLADLLPQATVIEASSDLAIWQEVNPVLSQLQPHADDVAYSASLRMDQTGLPPALRAARSVYFRLRLRE